jgi:hypothetical protein
MNSLDFPLADRDGEAEHPSHISLAAEYPVGYDDDVRNAVY